MTDESAAPAARRTGRTSSAGSAYGSKPAGRKFSDAAGRPFAAGERAGRSGFGRTRTEKSSAPRSRSAAAERTPRTGAGTPDRRSGFRTSAADRPAPVRPGRPAFRTEPEGRKDRTGFGAGRPAGGTGRASAYTPKPRQAKGEGEEGVRLNKFIANSGICSRREADEYILTGLVSVNDVIITQLGTKVFQKDVVKFNGERVRGESKVYLVMNKPKDFVTTTSDPHAEKTVLDLIRGKCAERVYPVGRLDKATTGVLLLTNDGALTEQLTHPSFEKKKIYHVFLDKNLKAVDFKQLLKGIDLEDGFIQADSLAYIDEDKAQVGIEIHSGRNRIIRRMFESLGYKIKKLDRVYFAGLTKKNLRRGQWRFLTEDEVSMLKMGAFE